MVEELPYIPTEIVNVIAYFTESSAGLAFIQTSKTYYKALSQYKITYFKQHQLEQINKNNTVMIDGKQYYGSAKGFYCNDCSCFLKKKDIINKHYISCHQNKSLICEHCDSPKPYHKVRDKQVKKKECIFRKFSCHYCKKSYHHVEHNSEKCPEKDTRCIHCDKNYKLKEIPTHDCNYKCNKCHQQIDYQTLYYHNEICPERIVDCNYCNKSYKVNNLESSKEHYLECKLRCVYCKKYIHKKDWNSHRDICSIECIKCNKSILRKDQTTHKYDCLRLSIHCELCNAYYSPNKKDSAEKHNQFCRSVCFKCGKFYKYNHVCDPSIVRVYDHIAECFAYYKE